MWFLSWGPTALLWICCPFKRFLLKISALCMISSSNEMILPIKIQPYLFTYLFKGNIFVLFPRLSLLSPCIPAPFPEKVCTQVVYAQGLPLLFSSLWSVFVPHRPLQWLPAGSWAPLAKLRVSSLSLSSSPSQDVLNIFFFRLL